MHTVATFVGRKYGTWLRSDYTFPTQAEAQDYANRLRTAEARADVFRFTRRVVAA
jgi:hypothetical protein